MDGRASYLPNRRQQIFLLRQGVGCVENGCFVCLKCGHGAAHANDIRPAVGVVQEMQDAENMMYNFFEFENEETFEKKRREMLKRKRL